MGHNALVVFWFATEMERTLQANDFKHHWSGLTFGQLLHRLRQEIGELVREITAGADLEKVLREATDVANFAMMIADNARLLDKNRRAMSEKAEFSRDA